MEEMVNHAPMSSGKVAGRIPPQNIELEQSVLGSILLDNEALPKALEVISDPDDFYKPAHRSIFEAMISLYEKGEPVDLMTVSEALRRQGAGPARSVSVEYLADLLETTPTAANVRSHARIVQEKSTLRKLITTAGEAVALAYEDEEAVDVILDQVEKTVLDISQQRNRKTLTHIKDAVRNSIKLAEELYSTKQLVTGAPTGYKDLDAKTAGLHPSDLIIVAGRPSMGKTAFAINIAQNLTGADENNVVGIFSLEMSSEQLVLRMLCSEARVSSQRLRTGYLSQSDWPRLTTAAGRLHNCNIYIDDTPAMSVLDVRSRARRLQAETGRLDLIIIDYLQLMSSRGKVESRVQEVSEITRSLKQLAKELHVPVLAISQLSRKVEERTDKRPQLADLRESGSIEQDADLVIFVYREEFYTKDDTPPEKQGVAEIIIGKQRNGPVGTVRLTFQGDYTRFDDMATGSPGSGYSEEL